MPITTVSDARAASAATLTSVDGIRLLHWPADDCVRAELADRSARRASSSSRRMRRRPRSGTTSRTGSACPLDPDELQQRARTLRRHARRDRTALGSTTTACCESATSGSTCRRARVRSSRCSWTASARWSTPTSFAKAYLETGGARKSARKTMIVRVRQRLGELGLELHNVRDSGYLLDWVDEEGATLPSATCAAS